MVVKLSVHVARSLVESVSCGRAEHQSPGTHGNSRVEGPRLGTRKDLMWGSDT